MYSLITINNNERFLLIETRESANFDVVRYDVQLC